jgi:hypothetical protein
MRYVDRFRLLALALALAVAGCQPVLEPPPEPTELKTVPLVEPKDLAPDAPVLKESTAPYTLAEPTPFVPESEKPAIVLPSPPPMSAAGKQLLLSSGGRELVLEFETGGKSGYDPHPEWPGGASGVTEGIGYDNGYYSRKVILSDWAALKLNDRTRLADTAGITGQRARAKRQEVKDIFVQWAIATDVFDRVDVAREYSNAKRAVPGFEDLRPNAQAAWISLGFNRGWQMSGPNRLEMRAARDCAPKRDYEGMAIQFRKMIRVWRGTQIEKGMTRRRIAEAKLIETP